MENENNDNMIKVKELDHKMVKFQKDSKDAAHKVRYRLLFFAGFVRPREILVLETPYKILGFQSNARKPWNLDLCVRHFEN